MNVAQQCRLEREQFPERFCRFDKCQWRVQTRNGPNPCRKAGHQVREPVAPTPSELSPTPTEPLP